MSKDIFSLNSLPGIVTIKPASAKEIEDAEDCLSLIFSNEYKKYLSEFGAIMADGIELSGITKSTHRNVVKLTQKEWDLNPSVPHSMYVIENTGVEGIIVWQDSTGSIFKTTPGSDPELINDSLLDYAKEACK